MTPGADAFDALRARAAICETAMRCEAEALRDGDLWWAAHFAARAEDAASDAFRIATGGRHG